MKQNKNSEVTRANLDKRTARKLYKDDFVNQIEYLRKNLSFPDPGGLESGNIFVAVRVRPLFNNEANDGAFDMISANNEFIMVHDCRMHADMKHMFIDTTTFRFNKIFGVDSTNEQIYRTAAKPLLTSVLSGSDNATIIMYGQTGTGKTYTMSGIEDLMVSDIFSIKDIKNGTMEINICCFEMFGNKCFDLLNNKEEVFLREGDDQQVHVRGVTYYPITTSKDLIQYIDFARSERTTSSTKMNDQSSRTHCIVRLFFDNKKWKKECTLTLVDLAGSEMSNDSMYHTADQRREGAEINKSLMSLKECIRFSSDKKLNSHIPYRSHKLTMLLKDCFENNNQSTLLIATVAPNPKDTEHTINTLKSSSSMNKTESYITSDKIDVSQYYDDDSLVPPIRFNPQQLRDWMASVSNCKFAPFVTNLASTIDGTMFIRFNDIMMKEVCNGDNKLGILLRKEFNKAIEEEKNQRKLRQAKARQQNVRDKLSKAKAI